MTLSVLSYHRDIPRKDNTMSIFLFIESFTETFTLICHLKTSVGLVADLILDHSELIACKIYLKSVTA